MNNILYIAPYRQNDGWGNMSMRFLMALNQTKYNITTRPIFLGNSYTNDRPLLELEENLQDKYDAVIQVALPNFFCPIPGILNIGLACFEMQSLNSSWKSYINNMDMLWVNTQIEQNILLHSGINIPIHHIPTPIDIEIYNKTYDIYHINAPADAFKFYYIGDYNERKDLPSMITAYYREFTDNENVVLILKTANQQTLQILLNEIQNIKNRLRLYKDDLLYPFVAIIQNYLTDDQLYSIHQQCDCFVLSSHGESCCLPALDALGFNNPIIIPNQIGPSDYIDAVYNNGYIVESKFSPVLVSQPPIIEMYNGHNIWCDVDILDLQNNMRQIFNQKNDARACKDTITHHDYKQVAKQIEIILK